jgi:hypothetical protein
VRGAHIKGEGFVFLLIIGKKKKNQKGGGKKWGVGGKKGEKGKVKVKKKRWGGEKGG